MIKISIRGILGMIVAIFVIYSSAALIWPSISPLPFPDTETAPPPSLMHALMVIWALARIASGMVLAAVVIYSLGNAIDKFVRSPLYTKEFDVPPEVIGVMVMVLVTWMVTYWCFPKTEPGWLMKPPAIEQADVATEVNEAEKPDVATEIDEVDKPLEGEE